MMLESERILAVLKDDLERAGALQEKTKRNFWAIAGKPAGNCAEERLGEIEEAAAAQSIARRAHVDAMIRLNAFLLDGTVPEHLRESGLRDRVTA